MNQTLCVIYFTDFIRVTFDNWRVNIPVTLS